MPDWDWIADDGEYFSFPFFIQCGEKTFLIFLTCKNKKATVDYAIVYSCGFFCFNDLIIMMKERWLAMKEISKYLGVTYETTYKCLDNHEMLGHRMGKFWEMKCEEVDAWVKSGEVAEK